MTMNNQFSTRGYNISIIQNISYIVPCSNRKHLRKITSLNHTNRKHLRKITFLNHTNRKPLRKITSLNHTNKKHLRKITSLVSHSRPPFHRLENEWTHQTHLPLTDTKVTESVAYVSDPAQYRQHLSGFDKATVFILWDRNLNRKSFIGKTKQTHQNHYRRNETPCLSFGCILRI